MNLFEFRIQRITSYSLSLLVGDSTGERRRKRRRRRRRKRRRSRRKRREEKV